MVACAGGGDVIGATRLQDVTASGSPACPVEGDALVAERNGNRSFHIGSPTYWTAARAEDVNDVMMNIHNTSKQKRDA